MKGAREREGERVSFFFCSMKADKLFIPKFMLNINRDLSSFTLKFDKKKHFNEIHHSLRPSDTLIVFVCPIVVVCV